MGAGAGDSSIAAPVVEPTVEPVNENEVRLSSGVYPKDTAELVAVVTPEDLSLLEEFSSLTSADFSGSSCYTEILSWM